MNSGPTDNTEVFLDLDEELVQYLYASDQLDSSDIHLKPGMPARLRINGSLKNLKGADGQPNVLTPETMKRMAKSTMRPSEWEAFEETWEKDYSIMMPQSTVRFRVNAYYTRGAIGMILRRVKGTPPRLESLGVPNGLVETAKTQKNGLILVTGATGSGKSTTLAGVVDAINHERAVHIVTIEDPIEFVHKEDKASISQRELEADTHSFQAALESAMRQDPDVILLGEMRSRETVETAIAAAETGHLVLSTLHTSSAPETITRLLDFFPAEEQQKVRQQLGSSLRAIACQRLAPTVDGRGRVPVVELLLNVGRVKEAITNPKKYDLETILKEGNNLGMQTFEDHLLEHVADGKIHPETAKEYSTNKHDIEVKLRNLKNQMKTISRG